MKTAALLSIVMAGMIGASSLAQNQQIPNGGFETWHTEGQGEDPDNWGSLFNQFNQNPNMATKTTIANSGTYALKLVCDTGSVFWIPGDTIYGSVNLGLVNAQISNAKVPFTSKPDSLTGYMKGTVVNGGLYMAMTLYKAGQSIGSAVYITVSSAVNYTRFSVPVTYTQSVIPDTLTFTIVAAHPGLNPPADPNNEFYVDDITLIYNQTAIRDVKSDIENRLDEKLHLEVFDVTGKKLISEEIPHGDNVLSMEDLSGGIYFYRLTDRSGKLVKSGKLARQ